MRKHWNRNDSVAIREAVKCLIDKNHAGSLAAVEMAKKLFLQFADELVVRDANDLWIWWPEGITVTDAERKILKLPE